MDSQLVGHVWAQNHSKSLHFTFPPSSAIAQISLSTIWETGPVGADHYDKFPVRISNALAQWSSYTTTDGKTNHLSPPVPEVIANELTEVQAFFWADNCYASAIINVFFWPRVWGQ
jgi:hypothetical protein